MPEKKGAAKSLAEFYNYHPQFGAMFSDIRETQYGLKGDKVVDPTRHYFFAIRLMDLMKRQEWKGCVLDIGCGMGILAQVIQDRPKMYVGMDISIERIRQSQDKITRSNCFFVVADAQALPFKDSSFQKAAALEVIEHLPNTEIFLRDVNRVLRVGGDFVLSTPASLFFEDYTHRLGKEQHLYEFSPSKMRSLLRMSFFHVLSVTGVGFKLPKLAIPLWMGSDFIKTLYKRIKHIELNRGYGNPICVQFDIVSSSLFNKLYFLPGRKKLWECFMKCFDWLGSVFPALSSTMVIVCRR